MFKKCKVVMLPTNEKATFNQYQMCIDTEGYYKNKLVSIHDPNLKRVKPQHLYITFDEEIKDNDWFYHTYDKSISKAMGDWKQLTQEYLKKIIATTDTSLTTIGLDSFSGRPNTLSQPSQQFIEKFIEEYNKGNVINNILVEYYDTFEYESPIWKLKVNPKDNTITIKKAKDSWNRKEIEILIKKAISDTNKSNNRNVSMNDIKWIKENL